MKLYIKNLTITQSFIKRKRFVKHHKSYITLIDAETLIFFKLSHVNNDKLSPLNVYTGEFC